MVIVPMVKMTLQLRWRNPRPQKEIEQPEELGFVNPFDVRDMDEFMREYHIQIPLRHRDKWRLLFPNAGQLIGFPHFGNVLILATDGLLAYYHVDFSGQLFLGHLKAFIGPIAKEWVDEDDWDWVNNKRKVNVFKRADGSYAIIPKDSFWDRYWSKHERIQLHQDDAEGEVKISYRKAPEKSKRQLLLESL